MGLSPLPNVLTSQDQPLLLALLSESPAECWDADSFTREVPTSPEVTLSKSSLPQSDLGKRCPVATNITPHLLEPKQSRVFHQKKKKKSNYVQGLI